MKNKLNIIRIISLIFVASFYIYFIVNEENKIFFLLFLAPAILGINNFFKWISNKFK